MSIPESEQRRLFARSGNRCAFADCRRILTAEGSPPDRPVVLGEMAHIVAERVGGPRGDHPMPLEVRNREENLILLCNNHHQLIDAHPQTYTVERLLGMKANHEAWVDRTLGSRFGNSTSSVPVPQITETVHSTLLAVEKLPRYVYGVPCDMQERSVQANLGPLRDGEIAPFIVRSRMLYAFQDLGEHGNPFESIARGHPIERFAADEWWEDPDQLGWYIDLLNRALNKLTGRRGLHLDREHRRYYFEPTEPGVPLSVTYTPLNQRQATRTVVWQPTKKSTGEGRGYWLHRAVALRFLRIGRTRWTLCIRPELRVTADGLETPPPNSIGARVTRRKSRTFNYDLLAEVQFWRDFLSESRPRILLSCGHARQTIVIGTSLMRGEVTWPGIPAEHAKPFRNVDYVDDLFSWAEFRSLEDALEEPDEDEWGEDDDEAY